MPETNDDATITTIGVLSYRLSAIEKQLVEVNRRLDGLQFVPMEVYRVEIASLERRVTVEENRGESTRRGVVFSFMYPTIIGILTVLLAVSR
jgi:hypothetical protein